MSRTTILVAALVTIVAAGIGFDWSRSDSLTRTLWQQAVAPGALSQSHAFVSNQCTACHTPIKGVEPALCISCHADNTTLLQRQPTAFHASVQVCAGCHVEHQATVRMPTTMDHSLLSSVGHVDLAAARRDAAAIQVDTQAAPSPFDRPALGTPQAPASGAAMGATAGCGAGGCGAAASAAADPPGARRWPVEHPGIAANESMLDCVRCHATKDRHQGLLGGNCVQCHATSQWTVTDFRHPSARSTECAQCHQPPPSHNMMHFSMMSAPLARQPNAKVNQCFMCHQTTAWSDIKGVGWIKHH